MAFVAITNCIELVIEATQWGEMRRTVLHAVTSGTVTNPDVDDAAAAVGAWLGQSAQLGLFHASVTFQAITAKDISAAGGYQTLFNMANAPGQAASGTPLPGNVACVISLHTSHGGRSGRGRVYMYGMTSSFLDSTDGNLLANSSVGAYHNSFNNLIAAFDSIGPKWAVGSRKLHIAYPVTSVTVDNKTDSQRRRLAGRGR